MFGLNSFRFFKRAVSLILIIALTVGPEVGYAQNMVLPEPGRMISVSGAFTPVLLKGMVIHPEDPLKFDFLMDTGTDKTAGDALHQEADKAIKYFLAALTTPDDDLWVNLSPVEKDRVIPDAFGKTVMGRDVLAQDYVLKQLASSLLYPENETGKAFWAKIYAETQAKFGTTDVNMDDFNRVWIMPSEASVWENDGKVVILKSHLKVMLEADYKAMGQSGAPSAEGSRQNVSQQILREVLIPAIEKEVNEGANFARLRQVYAAMILSSWYKIRLKEGLLGKAYADQNKFSGIEFSDGVNKDDIYGKYLEAVKQGAFSYIREESDSATGEVIPRKYFSGGFVGKNINSLLVAGGIFLGALAGLPTDAQAQVQQTARPIGNIVRVSAGAQDVGPNADLGYLTQINRVLQADDSMSIPDVMEVVKWYQGLSGGQAFLLWIGITGLAGYAAYKRKYIKLALLRKVPFGLGFNKLVGMLNDKDQEVREEVVKALVVLGDKRAIEPLLEQLKKENDGRSYTSINHNPSYISSAIYGALEQLTSDNKEIRYQVGLEGLKIKKAFALAVKLLEDLGDKRARDAIAEAMIIERGERIHLPYDNFNNASDALNRLGDPRGNKYYKYFPSITEDTVERIQIAEHDPYVNWGGRGRKR